MEAIIGPQPGKIAADIVRRVLDVAFDKGHPDPRHSEHWWDWKDWPFDGRQWEYDGQLNRYKFNKKVNAEWERRAKILPPNTGMNGSDLHVVRKLEGGLLWGDKKFPNGRTSIRSSRSFCPPSTSSGEAFMEDLFVEASNLTKRSSYDASIKPKRPIQKLPLNDKFVREFEEEFYKCKADILVDRSLGVLNLNFYICTDSFATRGEQLSLKEADGGVPSLSLVPP